MTPFLPLSGLSLLVHGGVILFAALVSFYSRHILTLQPRSIKRFAISSPTNESAFLMRLVSFAILATMSLFMGGFFLLALLTGWQEGEKQTHLEFVERAAYRYIK